jgi:DNA-binding CsgD family transcriptional regulator
MDQMNTRLSQRELAILAKLAFGLSNRDIGNALGITAETVRVHLRHIYPKIGVHNRVQAAIYSLLWSTTFQRQQAERRSFHTTASLRASTQLHKLMTAPEPGRRHTALRPDATAPDLPAAPLYTAGSTLPPEFRRRRSAD